MHRFEVLLRDKTAAMIDGVDVYQQEGSMTTFFALAAGREVVDCWSDRIASVRTADVLFIRRVDAESDVLCDVGGDAAALRVVG